LERIRNWSGFAASALNDVRSIEVPSGGLGGDGAIVEKITWLTKLSPSAPSSDEKIANRDQPRSQRNTSARRK